MEVFGSFKYEEKKKKMSFAFKKKKEKKHGRNKEYCMNERLFSTINKCSLKMELH